MAFEFDRYINGQLMAEGVTIERQNNLSDAMREAARIASRGPNGEVPVLVLRALAERAGGVKAPIGYALVPVEPTDRMVSAYVAAKPKGAGFNHPRKGDDKKAWFAAHEKKCRERWKAMLSVSALTTEPAAPEGRQEAVRIGDAVLDWMVKFDLLDAGNEYYVSDVLAVLNDLTPSTRPSEQAVTEAAQAVLEWYERDGSVGGAVEPFDALKAAMEAGRHD